MKTYKVSKIDELYRRFTVKKNITQEHLLFIENMTPDECFKK